MGLAPQRALWSFCVCLAWRALPAHDVCCWGEHAVETCKVYARFGHQGIKHGNEVQDLIRTPIKISTKLHMRFLVI